MAYVLPTWPLPRVIRPRLVSARMELNPAFGGPRQRLNRMGAHYALDVEMPPMTYADAQAWADIDDEEATCILPLPQPGVDPGAAGSPRVNGGAQSGSSIRLDGFTPSYTLLKNQWVTIITAGAHYCYRVRTDSVVGVNRQIVLPLRTMMRVQHADNDVVLVGEPVIEGFVTVDDGAWETAEDGLVRLKFTIEERA